MLKRVWRRLGWTSVTSVRESHCLYLSNEDNKRFSIVRRGLWIPNVCYPITCYRNVCNMSLVSFSSAVIFIIRSLIVLQVRVCPVVSRRRLQNTQVVIGQPSDTPSTVRPHPGGDRSTVRHPSVGHEVQHWLERVSWNYAQINGWPLTERISAPGVYVQISVLKKMFMVHSALCCSRSLPPSTRKTEISWEYIYLIAHKLLWSSVKLVFHYCKSVAYKLQMKLLSF